MLPLRMLGLLMFMFLLCDADSSCPPEVNPLRLEPPEIVQQYGNTVLVNCTSTAEEHEGMYWSDGTRNSDTEDEKKFISFIVTLSDWNVRADCKIKLNDTHECSKEVEITVYKNPEVVLSVKDVDATAEETQYELRCDIILVAPVQKLTVRWYKNNQTIKMSPFNDTTKTPVNESSILTVNISRGEDAVQFRCEAQLDLGPYGQELPVISETHNISAHYAPELNTTSGVVYVLEGENVTLQCEAEGNPPPVFHWTCDGVNMLEDTNSIDIPRVNDSATCTCTASNYLGNITKQFRVTKRITAAAPAAMTTPGAATPRVCSLKLTPSETVVRFGDPASINCSTSATDVSGMGWEAVVGGTSVEPPPLVTWKVEKLHHWIINPFCFITHNDTYQCLQTPTITVYKTPDIVSISGSDRGPMVEGRKYLLKCNISNVAPAQKLKVKWYRGNETVLTEKFNDTTVTPVNVSSTLEVTAERDYNGSPFRCGAELHLGPNGPEPLPSVTSAPYIAVVHYKPLIQACPGHRLVEEHNFTVDMLPCHADGNPPPTIQWYYQNELINTSEPLSRTDSGNYTAEFANDLGRSNISVYIRVEYQPSFNCNEHYDVEVNEKLLTKCEPEGLPTPIVTWFKDGKEVSPQHLTKHDSGEYLLKATNSRGAAKHTLYLNILYAPEFKKGNDSKEVFPGENVTLDCSAEGNPAPVIQWSFTSPADPEKATEWRQNIITVSRATSTNAGVYICVATNKVGNVTRSVTLVIKGKSSGFPLAVIWVLLILVIFILLLLIVFFHNRYKRHGQYSFVPTIANSSEIPLTAKSAGGNA